MRQDEINIELNKAPNIYWEKFIFKFSEISTLPIKDWKAAHLLAYWCNRYQDHYKATYSIRFNVASPSKSYEVWQIRKLASIISADPQIIKDYIDWFFETKIILKRKRITSMSFLTDIKNCNEYKFKKLLMDRTQNVDRTTALPPDLLRLAEELKIECKTYGDLAFLYKMVLSDNKSSDESIFIDKIIRSGFDILILNKVK